MRCRICKYRQLPKSTTTKQKAFVIFWSDGRSNIFLSEGDRMLFSPRVIFGVVAGVFLGAVGVGIFNVALDIHHRLLNNGINLLGILNI